MDPTWLIQRPTELSLRIEVTEQGPWGERQPPDAPRSFFDALPGDTLRFTPLVVDEDGPIPLAELDARWVVCPANECLDSLANAEMLPACDANQPYTEFSSCSPGVEPSVQYAMGPAPTDITEASLFSLAAGPNVALIASRTGSPGATNCAIALRNRQDMTGCVIMLRSVVIGPASTLLEAAETLGIDIEVSESLAPLLAVPRNRNPAVTQFRVEGSSVSADAQTVATGGMIRVQAGDELEISWAPQPEDIDSYEVELSGETLLVEEVLSGQFYHDRPTSLFEPGPVSLRLGVEGEAGRANVYFVLLDGGGSETWGHLVLDISAG